MAFHPFAGSPLGLFALWLIRPWLFCPLADLLSHPGRFAHVEYTGDSLLRLVFQFTERQQVSVSSRH